MRLITTLLAAILIALIPVKAQAGKSREAMCFSPANMHKFLIGQGLYLYLSGMVYDGFIVTVYASLDGQQPRFAIVAEDDVYACVLTEGGQLYTVTEKGI